MRSRIASRALLSNSLASFIVSRFSPSLLRPLVATAFSLPSAVATTTGLRTYHYEPNAKWTNRPPNESILPEPDGCDYEHWLCVMKPPEDANATRDDIIDSYIKTLAMVIGSEEEARMKIYSVSTHQFYVFGALVPEEVSLKIKELPRVRYVIPDEYLDVENKDFGGEPFINGQAVGYDKKYHEQWIQKSKGLFPDQKNKLDYWYFCQIQGPTGPPPPVRRADPQTAICLLGRITCNHLLCKTTSRDFLRRACLGILCSRTHPKTIRYPRAKQLSHRNDQELLYNHSPRWF